MKIIGSGAEEFWERYETVARLYEEAFTTGYYEQYMDTYKELKGDYTRLTKGKGTAYFAKIGSEIAGLAIVAPARTDHIIPEQITREYNIDKALEISKLGVFNRFSRRGIASALVQKAVSQAKQKSYNLILVRTPVTNTPAIRLYEKYGFAKSATVDVPKIKRDRTGSFTETKQYLVRKL